MTSIFHTAKPKTGEIDCFSYFFSQEKGKMLNINANTNRYRDVREDPYTKYSCMDGVG